MNSRIKNATIKSLRERVTCAHEEIKKCEQRIVELREDIGECHNLIDKLERWEQSKGDEG